MNIYVDRQHRVELQQAFLADEVGNLLLPADPIIGKSEDFNREFISDYHQAGPWAVGESERYLMKIKEGQYFIRHKLSDQLHFSFVPLAVDPNQNWGIETSIQSMANASDSEHGLCFGIDPNTGDRNLFYISTATKTFSIGSLDQGTWKIVFNNKSSLAINPRVNILRVESVDDYWHYYVNNYLLYCEPKKALYANNFGFAVDGLAEIAVDYFKIQW